MDTVRYARAACTVACLLVLAGGAATRSAAAVECKPQGTQLERNLCATLAADAAEEELQAVTATWLCRNAIEPLTQRRWEEAQAAWSAFREATLAAAFPCGHDDPSVCFGAATPAHYAELKTLLTRDWIEHLRLLLAADSPCTSPEGGP